ncbi:MAG: spore coat U domain-containing protein [Betaproteobacteria bacterium]
MKRVCQSLLACLLLGASLPGLADNLTASFSVTAKTVGQCAISANELAFSTAILTPIQGNFDAASTLTVSCSLLSPYSIALSLGGGPGANCGVRKMSMPGKIETLNYNLYIDSLRTQIWEDGTAGCNNLYVGAGTGLAQPVSVYGRIPPQAPAVGPFSDTIIATMTF